MTHYRTVFISDCHLGMKFIDSTRLLSFLTNNTFDTLYMVGDIIDGWALESKWNWPKINNTILEQFLKILNSNIPIFYLVGNHDEFLLHHLGRYHNLTISVQETFISKSGKKYLVTHGDKYDSIMLNARWLAYLGNIAYDTAFLINIFLTKIRNALGLHYWSFSAWAKNQAKSAVNFISRYEDLLREDAKHNNCDGVICGHIHTPKIETVNNIEYINIGDAVESFTAICEDYNGTLKIVKF